MFTSQGPVQLPLCGSARSVMQKVLQMAWMVRVLVDAKSSALCRCSGKKCLKNTPDQTAMIGHALAATTAASRTMIGMTRGSAAATLAVRIILADTHGTSPESLDGGGAVRGTGECQPRISPSTAGGMLSTLSVNQVALLLRDRNRLVTSRSREWCVTILMLAFSSVILSS